MKYIITESQLSRTKNFVFNKIDEWGLWKTIDRLNLNIDTLDRIFDGGMPDWFHCGVLNDLIKFYHSKGEIKLNKTKEIDGVLYGLKCDWDDFGNANYFKLTNFETKEGISGYATPYWEGNCYLPIDAEYYTYDAEEDFNEFNFHEYETFDLKTKFSSFSEFKEYADNEIPDIIINYIVRILPKTREESGGWDD